MIQLEDGNWAQKLGVTPSDELQSIYDVSTFNWDIELDYNSVPNYLYNYYNSTTVYFAISHDHPGALW